MTLKLLIVESPAKCKKIAEFLGAGWRVQATMGHIRALKEDLTAIGFVKGAKPQVWAPSYENITAKSAAIANLKKAASGAEVYLGSDDDREGEAIAWHTCKLLGLDPTTTPRVIFHEITETALKAAVASPSRIDMNKFNAQQARTMLDMLIGFTLSPCLWRGVGYKAGLSAGRCQTPALRIIYDRDIAIEKHQSSLSWRITATTKDELAWKALEEHESEEQVSAILTQIAKGPKTLTIAERTERISTSQPPKPFITSSLQQEASSRLSMNPKVTMRAAQTLYEAGHITYMRTDNAVLSAEAIEAASAVVKARWGEEYLALSSLSPDAPVKKVVKKKATKAKTTDNTKEKPEAQAAHEGIRPTHMDVSNSDELEGMGSNERRLYDLVWKRTIQTVMAAETRDVVKVTARPLPALTLEATWDQTRFAGWCILDAEKKEDGEQVTFESRKALVKDLQTPWTVFQATEVRTAPPPRYTEAALIRELETRGIGRPSTYATLVETVLDREYVEKITIPAQPVTLKGLELKATSAAKAPKQTTRTTKVGGEKDKVRTTPLGRTVIEWLLSNFGDMLEYDFTASMESKLDDVSKGLLPWTTVLETTWAQYEDRYASVMTASASASGTKTNTKTSNKSDFGDGYKMVVSKKGPLFVLEVEGQKTRFASVPSTLSIQTATRADAEAAFSSSGGNGSGSGSTDTLGTLDNQTVIRKKGPYGFYVSWGTIKLNCQETDTLADLEPRLKAKASPDAVDHKVGAYTIRKGPYGLYMFKPVVGANRKPTFVSIPDTTPWATLTPEGAEQLYTHNTKAKKNTKSQTKTKGRSTQSPNTETDS